MSAPGLAFDDVRLYLNGSLLVSLNAAIAPGEVLTVMGPSGVGKSTLLAFAAGFLDPAFRAEGRVLLNGADVTGDAPEARHMGLLFQDPLLFAHMSVAGNLLFGLPRAAPDRKARVEAALADAGLAGFGPRDPATLSGGQKARVALLRVLLSQPRAMLLDEPFSKLDSALRADIRRFVFERVRGATLPCLLVTHDRQDAEAAQGPVVEL